MAYRYLKTTNLPTDLINIVMEYISPKRNCADSLHNYYYVNSLLLNDRFAYFTYRTIVGISISEWFKRIEQPERWKILWYCLLYKQGVLYTSFNTWLCLDDRLKKELIIKPRDYTVSGNNVEYLFKW